MYGLTVFVVCCSRRFHPLGLRLVLWLFPRPVPLTGRETPHCFLQPQTPPVSRALLGFRHDMAQAWSGRKIKEKRAEERNGGWLLVLVGCWSDLGWDPGQNGQAGGKCT